MAGIQGWKLKSITRIDVSPDGKRGAILFKDERDREYAIEIPDDQLPYLTAAASKLITATQDRQGLGGNRTTLIELMGVGLGVLEDAADLDITELTMEFGPKGQGLRFWLSENLLRALHGMLGDRIAEMAKVQRPRH